MDYLSHVRDAVNYIEANLARDIKAMDVAQEAAFSRYHFHRIFTALVGRSVTGYIRRRRLTEAAHELIGSDRKIIDIALDYQFETPESFTRAFKKMYGLTPGQYRKKGKNIEILNQSKIDEDILRHLNGGFTMEPKIVTKDEFKIVGMKIFGENTNTEIVELWQKFMPRIGEIKNLLNIDINKNICFGMCYPSEEMNETGEFEYIASIEVSSLDDIPQGMVGRTIPRQKYAVFTHKGVADKIKETYKYIYGTWQPKSGCELVKAPDFEYYDERFDADNQEDSEMDIYIPIK